MVTEQSRSPGFDVGYELPLSREAFRRALRTGHGRARLHVDRHGAIEVRDDILEAATTSQVYDPQVEGLRADWLAELCVQAEIVDAVVQRAPAGSHWDRRLRSALLKEFAARGNENARSALYGECIREGMELIGSEEIVQLDGEPGLVFVARVLGRALDEDPSFWVDNSLMILFDGKERTGRADKILEEQAQSDASVRRYLAGVVENKVERKKPAARSPQRRRSVQEAVTAITAANEKLYWTVYWGRHTRPEELEPIVRIALSDSSSIVLENAFRCLSGVRTISLEPRFLDRLLHEDSDVRMFCARTLAHHVDPSVRAAGLAALGRDLTTAVTLLRLNAVSEDGEAISRALHPLPDPHHQHSLGSDLVHLMEDNERVREPLLALYVYEHSPCTNCRSKSVKILVETNACPDWLREEGSRDADEEVRRMCSRVG